MEPTNKSFEIPDTAFTRIEGGKIVERRIQPDMMGLLQQLGIASPPEDRPPSRDYRRQSVLTDAPFPEKTVRPDSAQEYLSRVVQ